MNKHIVLDTATKLKCGWCQETILIKDDKVVYGVGSAQYLKAFHTVCDKQVQSARELLEYLKAKEKLDDQTNQNSQPAEQKL